MKRILIFAALLTIFSYGFSQDYDRTGFAGEVSSALTIIANEAAGTEEESEVTTIIKFDTKNIIIGSEVYAIVSKEFDGIDLNTFLCAKRGSNFTIEYVAGDFIAISDNNKPDLVTYYMELEE